MTSLASVTQQSRPSTVGCCRVRDTVNIQNGSASIIDGGFVAVRERRLLKRIVP